ncbi:putative membrane protein, partial [Vibrio parahaemolyticus VPTS-2010]
MAFFTKTT